VKSLVLRRQIDDTSRRGIAALQYVHNGWMATAKMRSHEHFQLDPVRIKRAKRVLSAGTKTEAIDRALDMVIVVE
jgi:hypothetical protein